MGILTPIGYKKETFSEHLANIEKRWKARLEDDQFQFDFNTPEGIHNESLTYEISALDEEILELSNMFNIDGAKGIFLDYLQKLLPVEPRYTGKNANGLVIIETDVELVIPKDTVVTAGTLEYKVMETTILNSVNNEIYVMAVDTGTEYNIPERAINKITGFNVSNIYNPYAFTNGEGLESDSDFRYRLKNAKNKSATATYDAIKTALLDLDVVSDVIILDPKTTPATANGTTKIIVDGTPDRKIAKAILDTLAAGINTIADPALDYHTEEFLITKKIKTAITYNILKFKSLKIRVEVLEVNGEKDSRWTKPIQDELIKYCDSLGLGEPMTYNELHSEVNGIDEIRYAKVYVLDNSDNPDADYQLYNLEHKFDIIETQKYKLSRSDIEVVYV